MCEVFRKKKQFVFFLKRRGVKNENGIGMAKKLASWIPADKTYKAQDG